MQLLYEKNDWCTLEEIANKTKSSKSEIMTLLGFLAEYDFAILDIRNRKARIKPRTHKFLEEIRQAEIEEPTIVNESEEISLSNCRTP
jgi:DNA-binding IclR family transcriptional regulator